MFSSLGVGVGMLKKKEKKKSPLFKEEGAQEKGGCLWKLQRMFICVQDWTVETINQDLFQFTEEKNPTQETKQKTNILRLTRPTWYRKR